MFELSLSLRAGCVSLAELQLLLVLRVQILANGVLSNLEETLSDVFSQPDPQAQRTTPNSYSAIVCILSRG